MVKKTRPHWVEITAIVVTCLVVIVITSVMLFPRSQSGNGANLESVDMAQVKDHLKRNTKLDVTGVDADIKKGEIAVYYVNDDVRDEDEILFDIAHDATLAFPILLELTDAKGFKLVQLGTYVNPAGESSLEISATLTLTQETARDIDWKTVNATNRAGLIERAAEVYINPEVRAQLDDKELLESIIYQLSTH